MIVVCTSCQARFQYDEARFQGAPSKRFRCPKCSAEFEVANPLLPAPPTAAALPPIPGVTRPLPEGTPIPLGHDTTKRDRGAMLAAAGMGGLPKGKRFTLAFLTGPYASTVRVLDRAETVIGREEGEILTMDPETSRRHAQLEITLDGEVYLSDLGSTNGTLIDGVQIRGKVPLSDRQEFTCGKSTFMMMIRNDDTYGME